MPRKPYRDPKTGRFARRPVKPRDPKTGRFLPKAPPKKRPPLPYRDPTTGRFGKKSQHQTGWVDFTFTNDPRDISELPDHARRIFQSALSQFADRPALIIAHVSMVEEGSITQDFGWLTLAATQKLRASVNNLEWEVEALTLNVNYAQELAYDAVTFRINVWG